MFPTFWICCNISRIPSRRCIYWPDCKLNFRSNKVINSGQNCILYPVFNSINNIANSLSILSLKHLSKVFTFTVLPLIPKLSLESSMVKSRSLVPSLATVFSRLSLAALPIMISWSKSSNCLRSLLFDCLIFRVDTMFVLLIEVYWRAQH